MARRPLNYGNNFALPCLALRFVLLEYVLLTRATLFRFLLWALAIFIFINKSLRKNEIGLWKLVYKTWRKTQQSAEAETRLSKTTTATTAVSRKRKKNDKPLGKKGRQQQEKDEEEDEEEATLITDERGLTPFLSVSVSLSYFEEGFAQATNCIWWANMAKSKGRQLIRNYTRHILAHTQTLLHTHAHTHTHIQLRLQTCNVCFLLFSHCHCSHTDPTAGPGLQSESGGYRGRRWCLFRV